MAALLRILRVLAHEFRDAPTFCDEQVAEGLAVVDELRGFLLLRPVSAYAALLLRTESPLYSSYNPSSCPKLFPS